MAWPSKEERENFEIKGFIEHYRRLPEKHTLEVISKGERPDYAVRCSNCGHEFGVELTSVYLSDRSVPDQHIPSLTGPPSIVDVPFNPDEHAAYKARLLSAIKVKIQKAKNGYDLSRPLVLSVYVNEYTSLFLTQEELEQWTKDHESVLDNMAPFAEVVLWSLPNGGVLRIRPSWVGA